MQINKEDIKEITYDYEQSKMTIKLKEKRVVNNFMTDEVIYKCNYDTYTKCVIKMLKEDNESQIEQM